MKDVNLKSTLYRSHITNRWPVQHLLFLPWAAWLLIIVLACVMVRDLVWPRTVPETTLVWGRKPVLGYLTLTSGSAERLRLSGLLDEAQLQIVRDIASEEDDQLRQLEQSSRRIIENPDLSLLQKRWLIRLLGYRLEMKYILHASQQELLVGLGSQDYLRFVHWVEQQWEIERNLHGGLAFQAGPRTYRIFATHYKSKGAYIVALPDQCLKLSNGGSNSCADRGYQSGQSYTVFMSYKDKSAAALVGEVGPWNIDDNYWASVYDPQPRRMFADLPLGMPEAQAAYFNGYNGGVDQYGRTVTAPFGIDLGDGVGADIGLEPGANDWIDVTFMWTEGWNTVVNGASSGGMVAPMETANPNLDGSVVHEVQPGQALWSIAAAYKIDLSILLELNGLTDKDVIQPGDKLVIKLGEPTVTPEKVSHTTALPSTSATVALATPTVTRASPTMSLEAQVPKATTTSRLLQPAAGERLDPLLVGILVLVATGLVLVVFGVLHRH